MALTKWHTCARGVFLPLSHVRWSSQTQLVIYTTVQQRGGLWAHISGGNIIGCERDFVGEGSSGEPSLRETVSVVTRKAGAGGTLWEMFGLPSVDAFRSGWVRKKRQVQPINANYSLSGTAKCLNNGDAERLFKACFWLNSHASTVIRVLLLDIQLRRRPASGKCKESLVFSSWSAELRPEGSVWTCQSFWMNLQQVISVELLFRAWLGPEPQPSCCSVWLLQVNHAWKSLSLVPGEDVFPACEELCERRGAGGTSVGLCTPWSESLKVLCLCSGGCHLSSASKTLWSPKPFPLQKPLPDVFSELLFGCSDNPAAPANSTELKLKLRTHTCVFSPQLHPTTVEPNQTLSVELLSWPEPSVFRLLQSWAPNRYPSVKICFWFFLYIFRYKRNDICGERETTSATVPLSAGLEPQVSPWKPGGPISVLSFCVYSDACATVRQLASVPPFPPQSTGDSVSKELDLRPPALRSRCLKSSSKNCPMQVCQLHEFFFKKMERLPS